MMMVDNVVALLRPQHDRYHVAANERADLMRLLLSQAFAFFLDLAHAYRDLGGTQAVDRDRLQNRLARVTHGFLPAMASWQRPITSIAGRGRASQQNGPLMSNATQQQTLAAAARCKNIS